MPRKLAHIVIIVATLIGLLLIPQDSIRVSLRWDVQVRH
jgi:hypothetical protein